MGQPLLDYFAQYEDSDSVVIAGGTLTVFAAGTTNLISLYSDIDLKITLENPFTLDAAGMIPDVYYADGTSVKIEIRRANGTLFRTKDNLPAFGGPTAGVSVWASGQTYSKGEEVVYLGARYFSNIDNNIAAVPVDASIPWTRAPFQGVWNTDLSYIPTDRVIDPATGLLYICLVLSSGEPPASNPDKWGQGDGIGSQTINVGSEAFIPVTGAVKTTQTVTNARVPVATYVSTTDNSAQFSFTLPNSYDGAGKLFAFFKYYTATAATGTARFIASAYGLPSGGLLTAVNFTNTTLGVDVDEGVINKLTSSDLFEVNLSGTVAGGSELFVELIRDTANDDYTQSIEVKSLTLLYPTTSSVD